MIVSKDKPLKLLPAGHHDSHTVVILSGVIISLLVIILALTVANSRTSFFGRAASQPTVGRGPAGLSLENSYLFASPISAVADGSAIVRVTVIILNDVGLGIPGLKVNLSSSGVLNITQTQPVTDAFGRAIFDVTAKSPADYTISAEVQGGFLPQTVSVSFR